MSLLDELQVSANESVVDNPAIETPIVETPNVENVETPVVETQVEPIVENNIEPTVSTETKAKTFTNEQLAEADAFLTRFPEKTLEDYNSLKVPTNKLNEEELIKSYLSGKEGMTEDEIAYEMKKLEVVDEDDDFGDADEDAVLKAKAERSRILREATKYREDFVKEQLSFTTETTTTADAPTNDVESFLKNAEKANQELRTEYVDTIYKALGEIDTIPVTLNGEQLSFKPDEDFTREMRIGAEDLSNIGKEFFDENSGKIKDPKGFITETTLWANPKTRQPMLNFMIEQAILKDRANIDKNRRNINLDNFGGNSNPSTDNDAKQAVDALLNRRQKSSF